MTKKQREQVVELLRCAADRADFRGGEITLSGPFSIASYVFDRGVTDLAWRVRVQTMRDLFGPAGDADDITNDQYKTALLEAAQRCEEGSWP